MPRMLTVNEAADYLRVTPYTLRKWLRIGKIPGTKIGHVYRVPEDELDAAIRGESASETRNIGQEFAVLAKQWREETAVQSSSEAIAMHPAYQRIIGMGPAAVPLILQELQREPDEWFWALCAITGENPVRPEDRGNLSKMTDSWVRLGRDRGWI